MDLTILRHKAFVISTIHRLVTSHIYERVNWYTQVSRTATLLQQGIPYWREILLDEKSERFQ